MQELEDRQALEQAVLHKQLGEEAAQLQAAFHTYEQQIGLQQARASLHLFQQPDLRSLVMEASRRASPVKRQQRVASPHRRCLMSSSKASHG